MDSGKLKTSAAAEPSWELILDMGVEGGGFELFRRATGNGWLYRAGKESIALGDHDDEEWRCSQTGETNDWKVLLPRPLRYWHPTFVHADLRLALRRLLAPDDKDEEPTNYMARERRERWSRALGDAPPQR